MDRRVSEMDFGELRLAKEEADEPARRGKPRFEGWPSPLDELLSHWEGTHTPDPSEQLGTKSQAYAAYRAYQRALGEDLKQVPGLGAPYVRSHEPDKKAVLWFTAAFLMLRNGERARAAQHLNDLTRLYPDFPDPWIWLSATTDDPAKRIDYLENAVLLEPAHPLARDALAIAQGKVSPQSARQDELQKKQVEVLGCPHCGANLHYEPGAREVICQYCGRRQILRASNLINEEARLIGDLRLQRRLQGHTWREVQRVVHCQACGAALTMSHHLANQCAFCGSTSVRTADCQQRLEQPDGFLPFKLDQEQAAAAIARAQRSTSRRLKTWWTGQQQVIQALQAIYMPFWVFDGFVEVRKRAMASQSRPEDRLGGSLLGADRVALSSLYRDMWRSGQLSRSPSEAGSMLNKELMMFDNLVFSAMDFPPPWMLKKVLPYKLGALVLYKPRLLANWPAALYQRDVELAVKDAYNTMLTSAVWRKRRVVAAQPSDLGQLRRLFQVTTVTYQLVLLPVWVALARREQEQRLVLINGQTGQVASSSPLKSKS